MGVSRGVLLILMKQGEARGADGSRANFEGRAFELPLPAKLGSE